MPQKLLFLLISVSHLGFSQAHIPPSFYSISVNGDAGEVIALETDRSFYCTNERLYFTAGYACKYPIDGVQWSQILYVELIRWNGEKMAQAKFKIYEKRASGYLTIPGTLPSGNYYLRAYTRWMRNFPAKDYTYRLVKIINPFEGSIDPGPVDESGEEYSYIKSARTSYHGIDCFADKTSYAPREKVELTIQYSLPGYVDSDFCLSVAKAAHIDTSRFHIQAPDHIPSAEAILNFLPETRGISISGKIVTDTTPGALRNSRLHLSTLQNWNYFTNFHTSDNGLFYFTIPDFYGTYELYLDADLKNGGSAEILIDNDYCNRSIQLGYVPFSLDSLEEEIALEMAVNMQLSNMYDDENRGLITDSAIPPFYIRPEHVYYTSDYIQLPNLEEFFYELVKEVRMVRSKKKTYLKLAGYSEYTDLMPLVLIDNVPVLNVDELLRIPLDRIDKLEILDKPYLVCGVKYNGIIGIYTKRNDFAGIELHKNSLFFSYDLLSEEHFNISPPDTTTADKLAYRKNVLFWDPDIELPVDQARTLSFYTSDSKGDYVVYIRSVGRRGTPQIFGSCKITVE
jgi:hypothetical protein